ncbi:acyloxyacyl hydrolase [Saccharospirillum salsuginis]|uniref:Acyloxyacyl hydrolase n=1 Tax=Saccharospirillum salsuginis TaxID=418750 RepID=A0A918KCS0_9GAMM|nr:acyloxyacyl hydrolase [Saccharospirillum salsuginis]GGX58301.1 hypothetical protein GCM10007392_27650 [Saccharospirillum salsuginis]
MRAILVVALLAAATANADELKMYNLAVGTSVGTLLAVNAFHASSAGFDYAWDSGKERGRLLLQWDIPLGARFGPVSVTSGLELGLGQATYQGEEQPMANLTPLFDWSLPVGPATLVFETGLGAAYLTSTSLGPDEYSTYWQFSQVMGLGARYKDWQAGWRFQHISNGSVQKPNNGQNWYGLVVKYHY